MPVGERTLSEFLQHSGQVLPDLAEGEVLLHRRDGEDLILMTRRQSEPTCLGRLESAPAKPA